MQWFIVYDYDYDFHGVRACDSEQEALEFIEERMRRNENATLEDFQVIKGEKRALMTEEGNRLMVGGP